MSKISEAKKRVLDQFEQRQDEWTFGDFDNALQKSMGSRYKNYKDSVSTIHLANRQGKWPKTVERYNRSVAESFKQPQP